MSSLYKIDKEGFSFFSHIDGSRYQDLREKATNCVHYIVAIAGVYNPNNQLYKVIWRILWRDQRLCDFNYYWLSLDLKLPK